MTSCVETKRHPEEVRLRTKRLVVEVDAECSHLIDDVGKRWLEGSDEVFGSRYLMRVLGNVTSKCTVNVDLGPKLLQSETRLRIDRPVVDVGL